MNPKQLLITILILLTLAISAQVPELINYQAQLLDPNTDQPVADDTYEITFKIYDTEATTTAIWAEMHSVQTQTGMYNVLLGSQYPITNEILTGAEKWLGVKVGADNEMLPRKRFTSVAYALTDNDFKFTGNDIYFDTGNVGIGITEPTANLHVNGNIIVEGQSKVRGYLNGSDQSIPTTITKIQLNAENFDELNELDIFSHRFTALQNGYYLINAQITYHNPPSGSYEMLVYKNNSIILRTLGHAVNGSSVSCTVSDMIYLATGDFLELFTQQGSGSTQSLYSGSERTFLSVYKLP